MQNILFKCSKPVSLLNGQKTAKKDFWYSKCVSFIVLKWFSKFTREYI